MYHIVGVFNGEGPPVPIPNTEVKLTSAENTCLETDWEDRSMPTQRARIFSELFSSENYGGIAQLGEHLLCKQGVIGSIPIISTIWAHSSAG